MAARDTIPRGRGRALALLAAHGDDLLGVLADQRLTRPWLRFARICRASCAAPSPAAGGRSSSIAIHPFEPSVIGKQDAQVSDKQLAKRRKTAQLQTVAPRRDDLPAIYRNWSVAGGRRTIGEAIDTHLDENERLRWIVTCRKPKCRTQYLVTNTELLALLVEGSSPRSGRHRSSRRLRGATRLKVSRAAISVD